MKDSTRNSDCMDRNELMKIVECFFPTEGKKIDIRSIESGLINTTFSVDLDNERYILQQVNTDVFPDPKGIQENIIAIGHYLKENDYPKTILSALKTKKGELIHTDAKNTVWRMFQYIPKSSHFDIVPSVDHAFEAAKALGEFHQYLSDFDSTTLATPIQGFLDFESRRKQFEASLEECDEQRKRNAAEPLKFIETHHYIFDEYQKLWPSLPKRVIHGDPKISNFLFRENSTQVLGLIDWDTVMQGSVLYDFGDMVRSFTNRKDESDASSLPSFNAEIFNAIKEGVHQNNKLLPIELDNLLLGAKAVIYIQAVRFLTDYLNQDVYYKISYADQNLDRARNQIQLLEALLTHSE